MENLAETTELQMKDVSKFYDDLERKKLYRRELNRFKKILKELSPDNLKASMSLCENLAFNVVMLKELREIINRDGYSEIYMNGKNQTGIKRTVASDLLISAQKNYSMLFKQFRDLMPSQNSLDLIENWEDANAI